MSIKLFVSQIISWVRHHKSELLQTFLILIGTAFIVIAIYKTPSPADIWIMLGYVTLIWNFITFDYLAMRKLRKTIKRDQQRLWSMAASELERLKNEIRNS